MVPESNRSNCWKETVLGGPCKTRVEFVDSLWLKWRLSGDA